MYRMRKKLGLIKPLETLNDTATEEEVQSISCSFKAKLSLSRSVNKAQKDLLAILRKTYKVTGKLVRQFKLRICEQKKKRDRKNKNPDDKHMKWIEAFVNRSDITYMNLSRKGNIYIGKFNEGKYKQKRYFL